MKSSGFVWLNPRKYFSIIRLSVRSSHWLLPFLFRTVDAVFYTLVVSHFFLLTCITDRGCRSYVSYTLPSTPRPISLPVLFAELASCHHPHCRLVSFLLPVRYYLLVFAT